MAIFNVGTGETVKIDLVGSTHNVGLTSYRYDRAIRRCVVTNLSVSADDSPDQHDILGRAINLAVVAATGSAGGTELFHHIITTLPLQQARARQRGKTSVWVDLLYARGRWASLPSAANVIASARQIDMPTPVYRLPFSVLGEPLFDADTSLPDGPLYIILKENTGLTGKVYRRPQTYMWPRPAFAFSLPTFRSSSPVSAIDHLVGKTNDADFTIGGVVFIKNTLMVEAPDVDWTSEKTGGDWFDINFKLIGMPIGFNVQHIFIDTDSGSPKFNEWDTINGPEFEQVSFADLLDIL